MAPSWARALQVSAAAALLVATGTRAGEPAPPAPRASPSPPAAPRQELFQAEPPPFSPGIFPCSQCHTSPGDPTRRTLSFHEDVQSRFRHDSEHRWCLDCHDRNDRDVLHLSSGEKVPFTESYRLCGQCHGDKYRDWRVGVHGKRVGMWNGPKTYYLCVNCHDPHSPRFKPIRPMPPPVRPEAQR